MALNANRRRRACVAVLLVGLVAGCAGATEAPTSSTTVGATQTATAGGRETSGTSGPAPTGPTVAPTVDDPTTMRSGRTQPAPRPTVPPSDEITGVWVLGTVAPGSAAPCFELLADDGRVLTIYSSKSSPVSAGDRIRARLVSPVKPLYCGADEALRLLEAKPAG